MEIFKEIIDWMWENTWDSKKPVSLLYVVSHQPLILRGSASPRQCIVRAIKHHRDGNPSLAINWLLAGVAHDPESRDELYKNKTEALDYATKCWGDKADLQEDHSELSPMQLRDILAKCMDSLKNREVTWKDFSETSTYKNAHIET